jgi:CHAT domain-containing protein/tetratricopeptide (TPR) repeat protein
LTHWMWPQLIAQRVDLAAVLSHRSRSTLNCHRSHNAASTVRMRLAAALVILPTLLTVAAPIAAQVGGVSDINTLQSQVVQLYGQGKYSEAIVIAQRALTLGEQTLGREHPDTLTSVNNLALLYEAQGRYGEAEPLCKHALEGRERVLGREHPDTLISVNNLAQLYEAQGRYGEAEPLHKRALEGRERVLGREHPKTLTSVNNLAALYDRQGRYSEAEPLYKRALEASERVLGKEHPQTLGSVANLAVAYATQGRYGEAEPLFKRALEGQEQVLGREHPQTLTSVNNLASLYKFQGRFGDAELLFKRALGGNERVLGGEHPYTLASIDSLATLYEAEGRYAEAEPLCKRALEGRERVLGREHPDTLISVNSLASVYGSEGRYGEAETLYRRALAGRERVLGREHPDTIVSLHNLAALYHDMARYGEAEPLLKHALEASERVLGKEHPQTLGSINNLAVLYFVQGDWDRAAQLWRRSTAAIARREQRSALDAGQTLTGKKKSETERLRWQFWGLVKTLNRLAPEISGGDVTASRETFQSAQWAVASEAAQSLAQMAARGATTNPTLEPLVRERQNLVEEWQKRDGWRSAALEQGSDKRDAEAEAANQNWLVAIDQRIAGIDGILKDNFPDYFALASPAPLAIEEVQSLLHPNEALVLFLDTPEWKPTPEETFIWVVTKTNMRWARSDFGTAALARNVQALRCGLDATAWEGGGWNKCRDLTGAEPPLDNGGAIVTAALPFQLDRSHSLYKALFGGVEDLIAGKSILIVPSGTLTQLPFQVLVTKPAQGSDYKSVAWLSREHALAVLPAVSSLKVLRRVTRPSAANKPMIGFGNPLLDGNQKHPLYGTYFKQLAQLAREKQSCAAPTGQKIANVSSIPKGILQVETRGGLADNAFLRMQAPLPETADELCAVAHYLGANESEIWLGARATEREVKRLSETGELAQYRVVHFATHGALAGQISGNAEPGLLMTPPDKPSKGDDGYLSASEIAALKLDADWVILSACNTAAGGAQGAQALSGLARAFIYAQARSMLVSHWEVDSAATVKLITGAMSRLAKDKTMGRAEAVRQSMLALIDQGELQEMHPAYWAPFVLVGEGAAGR